MAVMLHERGLFTWREWADRLAAEIPAARGRGEEDDGTRPGTVIFRGGRPSGAGWRSVCNCRRDPARINPGCWPAAGRGASSRRSRERCSSRRLGKIAPLWRRDRVSSSSELSTEVERCHSALAERSGCPARSSPARSPMRGWFVSEQTKRIGWDSRRSQRCETRYLQAPHTFGHSWWK